MNDLSLPRPRLWTYLWVCGVAVALGWGIRGQFGHERGAMIPGVLGALAVAVVSPDDRKRNRVAALGVAGGLGMAIGGSMSYGAIAGSLGKPGFHGICTALLIYKGAVWGGFAGGVFGMALGTVRYAWRELLWLPPLIGFYMLASYLFPAGELSRHDGSRALTIALLLFLGWLWFAKRDRTALFFAACSLVGFGFGFPFGSWLCVWGERTGIPIDWWKVAEMSWGLCGGLSWGLAAYVLDEDLVHPQEVSWSLPTWSGLAYIAWLVPFWNGFNAFTYWVEEKKVLPVAVIPVYLAVVALLLLVAIMTFRRNPPRPGIPTTVWLFLWVIWSTTALQFLKMGYPGGFASGGGFWWTQAAFAGCGALLTLYALRAARSPAAGN
jgi:hypothetical protein